MVKEWAAPYRADFIVHAGKPVDGVDFVLGRPTRVHGRLFVGKEGKPAPNSSIRVFISQEVASDEIRIKGEAYRPHAEMNTWVQTDDARRVRDLPRARRISDHGPATGESL